MLITKILTEQLRALRGKLMENNRDVSREVMEAVATALGKSKEDLKSLPQMLAAGLQERIDELFALLRKLMPIMVLKEHKFALVTRFDDVQEVLSRDRVFQVTYQEKMEKITDSNNFFLGMQNTPTYTRDVSNMRLVVRRGEVEDRIAGFVRQVADGIVGGSGGRIDFV